MIRIFRSILSKLPLARYLCGNDTFIRHWCTINLVKKIGGATLLDVGGEGLLRKFDRNLKITTANVKKADITLTSTTLPCTDGSFDVVTSIDTLEHLPQSERQHFISELYRVCRNGFVICAPLGTDDHIRHIKALVKYKNIDQESKHYLEEHIRFGLPTPEDVALISGSYKGEVFYQGTYKQGFRPIPRILAYPRLILFAFQNMCTDLLFQVEKILIPAYQSDTNRFFIVVKKY